MLAQSNVVRGPSRGGPRLQAMDVATDHAPAAAGRAPATAGRSEAPAVTCYCGGSAAAGRAPATAGPGRAPAVTCSSSCYCWSRSCSCSWTSSWIREHLTRLRFEARWALNMITLFLDGYYMWPQHARAPAPVPAPEPDARIGRRALGPMYRSR